MPFSCLFHIVKSQLLTLTEATETWSPSDVLSGFFDDLLEEIDCHCALGVTLINRLYPVCMKTMAVDIMLLWSAKQSQTTKHTTTSMFDCRYNVLFIKYSFVSFTSDVTGHTPSTKDKRLSS